MYYSSYIFNQTGIPKNSWKINKDPTTCVVKVVLPISGQGY